MKGDQMGTDPTNPSPRELPLSNQTRFKKFRRLLSCGIWMHIGQLSSAREPCQILEILSALLGAPVVAGLIFGAHQAVRSASAVGRGVEVAPSPPDAVLNVAPGSFGRLEDPGLALRISEEAGQLGTVGAVAG